MTSANLPPAIDCRDVSYRIDGRSILEHVTFTLAQGEFAGIVGPNGGGKTTLLKLITGILQPTSGEIHLFGSLLSRATVRSLVGYVPQHLTQRESSFPATVAEIIRSGRTPRVGFLQRFSHADEAAVQRAMDIAGVREFAGRRIAELSGGEMQKVYIARALAAEPKLLLLDEPTTGVDLPSREQFTAFLQTLHRDLGLTIVLVSHDVEAMTKGVQSVLCVNGTLLSHCSSDCFLDDECFRRLYGDHVDRLWHAHPH